MRCGQADRNLPVVAGQTLQGVPDIGLLLITTRDGRPVYVKDVATVVVGGRPDEHRAWHLVKAGDGSSSACRPSASRSPSAAAPTP